MSLILLAAIQASQLDPVRVPVADECASNPAFVEYRKLLVEAVGKKDVAALQPLVAPDVKLSFGTGKDGWSAFLQEWGLNQPHSSAFWTEMAQILSLGCSEYDSMKFMPTNFSDFGDVDASFPPYWVVQERAALRSQPSRKAPVVALLDHHLLYELDNRAAEGWLHARLSDGRAGYVERSAVRSAIDYRASFELQDGRWLMKSFLAGD